MEKPEQRFVVKFFFLKDLDSIEDNPKIAEIMEIIRQFLQKDAKTRAL
jgi:hypothetical protein